MRHERYRSDNVPRPSRRTGGGFTLVELLVVIGIILLLMAVSTLVLGNVIQSARIRATEATIAKINGMMQERAEAFQRSLEKKGQSSYSSASAMLRGVERGDLNAAIVLLKLLKSTDLRGQTQFYLPEIDPTVLDGASDRTWEALARKLCYRVKFPMSFREVAGFNGKPGDPDGDDDNNGVTDQLVISFNYYSGCPDPGEFGVYSSSTPDFAKDDLLPFATLLKERMTAPQKHRPETESAEMLYLILTAGDVLGAAPVGSDEFSTSEVRDTDGDGLLEFVDGWGRPLRFYRWPTRLLRCGDGGTTPSGPTAALDRLYASLLIGTLPSLNNNDASLMRDPDDGLNLIYTQVIKRNTSTTPTANPELNARLKLEYLFHTPETYFTMLIVSAGPDGRLGMYEPVQYSPFVSLSNSGIYGHLAQLARDSSKDPTDPDNVLGDPGTHPISDNITNRRR
jgi:prepilin-type N-terminal cleavage/methylation domain-containing protein